MSTPEAVLTLCMKKHGITVFERDSKVWKMVIDAMNTFQQQSHFVPNDADIASSKTVIAAMENK